MLRKFSALPPDIQPLWGQTSQVAEVREAIERSGTRETLEERIYLELASAAATLEKIQMTGLAEECRSLARPFKGRSPSSSGPMP